MHPDEHPDRPARFDVIGCRITRADMTSAIGHTTRRLQSGEGGYVCFTNVHASVTGRRDPAYRQALDHSFMTLPDGKPLYWVARARGLQDVGHVPGPDFMPEFIEHSRELGLRHYFFGSTPEVLDALTTTLRQHYPDIRIVGSHSPPFRALSKEENRQLVDKINAARPDIIWIGLGAPKQELWMNKHWRSLRPAVLMGVGAAFDFHAGTAKRAPAMFTRLGLEWLYRLVNEPRRLWKRYLVTNTLFVGFLIYDRLRRKGDA